MASNFGLPSGKLILDDPKKVNQVLDRGYQFRTKVPHSDTLYNDSYSAACWRVPDIDSRLIDNLRDQLDAKEVKCAVDGSKKFIPHDILTEILTFDTVRSVIYNLACFDGSDRDSISTSVYNGTPASSPCVRLLGVLIIRKQTGHMARLYEDGVRDSCLPLRESEESEEAFVCRQHERACTRTINTWGSRDRKDFAASAYSLSAPFIKWHEERHSHYVLDAYDILPMEFADNTSQNHVPHDLLGGFGQVHKVKIRPSQFDFKTHGIRHPRGFFAVKELTSPDRESFNYELSSLIFSQDNKHLIQLLATFEVQNTMMQKSRFYFLFDWAEGTMQTFWRINQVLICDRRHGLWMAQQFHGICEALGNVHNDRYTTLKYLEDRFSNKQLYGRHGDIKPGNFLWFSNKNLSPPGTLVLSDFGLGRLHTQVSRSNQDPKNVYRSATYRCPEFDLREGQLSRRSDIFSLGCVFLEYVTWFLMGCDAVEEKFPKKRMSKDIYEFDSDIFFTIEGDRAILKPTVAEWIDNLHRHPDCTCYISDLLDLIRDKMLNPDSSQRIEASQLTKKMRGIRKACETDESYYLKRQQSDDFS